MDSDLDLPSMESVHRFAATAQTGSFSAAAHQLGLNQATVSQSVARLEGFVGARLFDRAQHRAAVTQLTREGKLILPTATRLIFLGASMKGYW